MADYTWELGIDWNAVETDGARRLRQGLVRQGSTVQGSTVEPNLKSGDRITFKIFDVTNVTDETSPQLSEMESFTILTRAADINQPIDNLLDCLHPTIPRGPDAPPAHSMAFENVLRSWTSPQFVHVGETEVEIGFLLTFQAQARGLAEGSSRLFSQDPEMVVGPFG